MQAWTKFFFKVKQNKNRQTKHDYWWCGDCNRVLWHSVCVVTFLDVSFKKNWWWCVFSIYLRVHKDCYYVVVMVDMRNHKYVTTSSSYIVLHCIPHTTAIYPLLARLFFLFLHSIWDWIKCIEGRRGKNQKAAVVCCSTICTKHHHMSNSSPTISIVSFPPKTKRITFHIL